MRNSDIISSQLKESFYLKSGSQIKSYTQLLVVAR